MMKWKNHMLFTETERGEGVRNFFVIIAMKVFVNYQSIEQFSCSK